MNEAVVSDPYKAPASNTAVAPKDNLLAAYVGPKNTAYYLRRFERFQAGDGKLSWHWPAFFVTSYWLLYRKMWLWALLYIVGLPILLYALGFVLGAALEDPVQTVLAGNALYLVLIFIVAPLLANWLYFRHAQGKVASVSAAYPGDAERAAELARKGGTSAAWIFVLLILALLGVLAAIAIPAYQDYTIRAQVASGLSAAAGPRAAVEGAIAATGALPADNAAAGLPEPGELGNAFVAHVTIRDGNVGVFFGNAAHDLIAGRALVLEPAVGDDGTIEWVCNGEDLEPRLLPSVCR